MTSSKTASVPKFRVHAAAPAFVRALWVAALCAALTGGFLHEVWHAPAASGRSADRIACAPGQGHAC
ncbi:MAG TPA: hypothetical protein VEM76_05535 [Anaeromyxobacteraceae bacterium]|nr:hypothetical protein [Anaeromyxobacteraceae bacterium]